MSLRNVKPFSFSVTVLNSTQGYEVLPLGYQFRHVLQFLTISAEEINQPPIDIQVYIYDGFFEYERYVCGGLVWSSNFAVISAGSIALDKPMGLNDECFCFLKIYYNNRASTDHKIIVTGVFAR